MKSERVKKSSQRGKIFSTEEHRESQRFRPFCPLSYLCLWFFSVLLCGLCGFLLILSASPCLRGESWFGSCSFVVKKVLLLRFSPCSSVPQCLRGGFWVLVVAPPRCGQKVLIFY